MAIRPKPSAPGNARPLGTGTEEAVVTRAVVETDDAGAVVRTVVVVGLVAVVADLAVVEAVPWTHWEYH